MRVCAGVCEEVWAVRGKGQQGLVRVGGWVGGCVGKGRC